MKFYFLSLKKTKHMYTELKFKVIVCHFSKSKMEISHALSTINRNNELGRPLIKTLIKV